MRSSEIALGETYKGVLGQRLKIVAKRFNNREEAAKAAGVSKPAFEKWVYGASAPSFESIVRLSVESGVSLEWIAFGEEETRHEGAEDRTKVGYDLMDELFNDLKEVYQAEGWLIMPESAYKVALDLYREVQTLSTISERRTALKSHVRMHAKHGIRPPETASAQDQSSVG